MPTNEMGRASAEDATRMQHTHTNESNAAEPTGKASSLIALRATPPLIEVVAAASPFSLMPVRVNCYRGPKGIALFRADDHLKITGGMALWTYCRKGDYRAHHHYGDAALAALAERIDFAQLVERTTRPSRRSEWYELNRAIKGALHEMFTARSDGVEINPLAKIPCVRVYRRFHAGEAVDMPKLFAEMFGGGDWCDNSLTSILLGDAP